MSRPDFRLYFIKIFFLLFERLIKMSYYNEIDRDLNVETDELLISMDKKRLKKNQNHNSKHKSNSSKTVDEQLETYQYQQLFETESCNMNHDQENNDVPVSDADMSVGSSSLLSEKESNHSCNSYIEDFTEKNYFDSLSDDDLESEKESPLLFKSARLNVRNFSILFMATVDKLGIAEDKRDMVLDLIRYSLPTLNELPLTYHMIAKIIPKPEISSFLLCKICNQEISSSKYNDSEDDKKKFKRSKALKKCLNEDCSSNRIGLKSRSFVKVFSLNIFSQLKIILENNEKCIKSNIGKTIIIH